MSTVPPSTTSSRPANPVITVAIVLVVAILEAFLLSSGQTGWH